MGGDSVMVKRSQTWKTQPLINVLSETITEKPAFRQAIRFRRCIITASGFFETHQGDRKAPLYVYLKNGSPMIVAGLWDIWNSPESQNVFSCCILTTSSKILTTPILDRMHPGEYSHWLDRVNTDAKKLKHLYQLYPFDLLEMYPVSHLVNSIKIDSPDHIKPVRVI